MLLRISKMLGALGVGVAITLFTQFVLPPAMIHYYGVTRFGEWLVISATLSYMSTLNFGVTTYASNELTMLYRRADLKAYRRLGASTLLLLLAILGSGAALCCIFLILPLSSLLKLSSTSQAEAQWCAFFLGMLALVNILAGYFNSVFMVVEQTHRGTFWWNWRRLAAVLVAVPLAVTRCSFATIAGAQLLAVSIITVLSIVELRRRTPYLPLGLRGAHWPTIRASLEPSGLFALVFAQNFLVFQMPVILLQWLAGTEMVVIFTVSRTVLATARQVLGAITNAIAPEITLAYGAREMGKLLEIFHHSEKVVFALIPVANLGVFLLSPLLLQWWLHKPELFHPWVFGMMALISAAMSMREHKQFFQFATNVHKHLSYIVFGANVAMLAVSVPATTKFGIPGFLAVWLMSELCQMALLYRENKLLFDNDASITFVPVVKLLATMLVGLPLCHLLIQYGQHGSDLLSITLALCGVLVLLLASCLLFDVRKLFGFLPLRKEMAV
jgi:O-antigen/teichoic acid export membrane protein